MPSRARHRRHANPFTVRGPLAVPQWGAVYAQRQPFALDVGFGAGAFLLELARKHPQWNVLGLEIRQHLVDGVLARAHAEGLRNVHALVANANSHLSDLLPNASVAFVAVNFPDPWYKKRHHKRRVVGPEWLAVLRPKLLPGAEIHAMTDYEPVAAQMREVLGACPWLQNLCPEQPYCPQSTTGIATERELKHLGRGDPIYRLHFRAPFQGIL